MLAKQVYHAAEPYIISRKRYIIEKRNVYNIMSLKEGAFLSENKSRKSLVDFTFSLFTLQVFNVIL